MPTEKMIIKTSEAPQAIGPYNQGVTFKDTCYFSGMLGIDPKNGDLRPGFDNQLEQILINIDALLKSQNLKRDNILKTTIFLKDLSHFPKVNQAYESYFKQPYPARSCVEVKGLPKNAEVEIEVVAGIF